MFRVISRLGVLDKYIAFNNTNAKYIGTASGSWIESPTVNAYSPYFLRKCAGGAAGFLLSHPSLGATTFVVDSQGTHTVGSVAFVSGTGVEPNISDKDDASASVVIYTTTVPSGGSTAGQLYVRVATGSSSDSTPSFTSTLLSGSSYFLPTSAAMLKSYSDSASKILVWGRASNTGVYYGYIVNSNSITSFSNYSALNLPGDFTSVGSSNRGGMCTIEYGVYNGWLIGGYISYTGATTIAYWVYVNSVGGLAQVPVNVTIDGAASRTVMSPYCMYAVDDTVYVGWSHMFGSVTGSTLTKGTFNVTGFDLTVVTPTQFKVGSGVQFYTDFVRK